MRAPVVCLVGLVSMMLLQACGGAEAACANTDPRCPSGQICVKERIFLVDREVCKNTEALKLGAKCHDTPECKGANDRTAVCADMQRRCALGTEPACDLRCRPVCTSHDQCGPDQICWTGGGDIPGVCQEGECGETKVDCPGGLRCLWFKPGDTGGICYPECDLLRQSDCNQSPPPTDAKCCAPQEACVHFASNPATATCLPVGTAHLGDICSTQQTNGVPSCGEGLFCTDLICPSGTCLSGQCAQYCNRAGGAPACDRSGAICGALPNGGNLQWGYCN